MISENEKIEIYRRGFNEGQKHIKSSPETLDLIEKLEERISEKISIVVSAHETKELSNYEEVRKLFVSHIEETKELNEAFKNLISGGKLVSSVFSIFVKTVAGLGVLIGAVYAIKEWIKK